IKRLMTANASEVIGLVDHTKWERAAFATFCRTADVDAVVADAAAPGGMVDELRGLGVDVHLVEPTDAAAARSGRVRAAGSAPW
ncbi:MAG: hypothetical protein ACJ767_02845, partial [Chloroflexota bacterium]